MRPTGLVALLIVFCLSIASPALGAGVAPLAPPGDEPARRLVDGIPAETARHFDLFLYVSKAVSGPLAQHMFVYRKQADGSLMRQDSWPVSTGREKQEKYFTTTPSGIFKLDPERFYRVKRSSWWNNGAMPWAMFFDYSYRTRKSGLAMHAASTRTAKKLGTRASGGCIRMPPEDAKQLYQTIQRDYRGSVPEFAFNHQRGTTDRNGKLKRRGDGSVIMDEGYRVLLLIEDYGGTQAVSRAGSVGG